MNFIIIYRQHPDFAPCSIPWLPRFISHSCMLCPFLSLSPFTNSHQLLLPPLTAIHTPIVKVKVKLLHRVRLFVTPWTVAHQAPPSMESSRQEYWSGLPFLSPEDLPDPGIEPGFPRIGGRRFNLWATREAQGHVRTQLECSNPQAKERGLRGN